MKTILLLAILLTSSGFSQDSSGLDLKVPPEVKQIVEDALQGKIRSFFDHFADHKKSMGIPSTTNLADIKVGEPVISYVIPLDSLSHANENTSISELIKNYGINYSKKAAHYEVPLLLNGIVINKVKVWKANPKSQFAGQWRLVGWGGGVGLENEWQKILQKWPKHLGYTPFLI
jgi:hypothetical protein